MQRSLGVAPAATTGGGAKQNGNGKAGSGASTPIEEKNMVVPAALDNLIAPPS